MNKCVTALLVAICILTLILSGCSNKVIAEDSITSSEIIDVSSEDDHSELKNTMPTLLDNSEKNYCKNEIIFPTDNEELTEYNMDILNIDAFSVSFLLPIDWEISNTKPDGKVYVYNPVFSMHYVFNESNTCVGAVGYNVIPELSDDNMMPAAIYSQIDLGNGYRFDIREKYDIVKSSDISETALTYVYYSDSFNDGNGEIINKGIVLYDTSKGIYIAFEFDNKELTEEQYTKIAKSINII